MKEISNCVNENILDLNEEFDFIADHPGSFNFSPITNARTNATSTDIIPLPKLSIHKNRNKFEPIK